MESFLNSQSQILSPTEVLIALFLCAGSGFLLKIVYDNFSNYELANSKISSILPILSLVTFLIISIIKSSIALSLGLVGALSIVRFRAPIKEPEELLYLFLSIAVGIGFGSNQIYITSLIFFFIIIIIWFYSKRSKKIDFNVSIEWDEKIDSKEIITKLRNSSNLKIQKYEITNNQSSILAKISIKDTVHALEEFNKFKKDLKGCNISVYHEENNF
jgi:hypothetical protein